MATPHYIVLDDLELDMQLYGELLGCVYTIIYEVALHWHSYTHVLTLKNILEMIVYSVVKET